MSSNELTWKQTDSQMQRIGLWLLRGRRVEEGWTGPELQAIHLQVSSFFSAGSLKDPDFLVLARGDQQGEMEFRLLKT